MEAPLEIRYAGVVIGRAQEVRNAEGDPLSFFIPVRDPMPVGTVLHMRSGEQETPVRVVRAVETTDAATCGMQVRTIGEAEVVARDFIPPPAPPPAPVQPVVQSAVQPTIAVEKRKAATPTPVVEVDLSKLEEQSTPAEAATATKARKPVTTAAPEPEPAEKPAEPTPVELPAASVEVAAAPDAVPVVVAASMTGALRNATESVQVDGPAKEAAKETPAVPSAQAGEPASPQVTVASAASYTREYGSVVESASQATESSAAVSGGQPPGEDLPPARPIAGPSGRRKTKRRK